MSPSGGLLSHLGYSRVDENDTLNTLYKRFLYPAGVEAMAEAVEMIAKGTAPRITQPEEGASYEPYITAKPELAELDWKKNQWQLHNFIRGNDKVPGAWATLNGEKVTFFGSSLWKADLPKTATEVEVAEVPGKKVFVHEGGLLLPAADGKWVSSQWQEEGDPIQVNVDTVKIGSKSIPANKYGLTEEKSEELVLNDEEKKIVEKVKVGETGRLGKGTFAGDLEGHPEDGGQRRDGLLRVGSLVGRGDPDGRGDQIQHESRDGEYRCECG